MYKIDFVGSKINRYKEILKIAKEGGYKNIIEIFGGSMVISTNIQNEGFFVIANDFDYFKEKLKNKIVDIEALHLYLKETEFYNRDFQKYMKLNEKEKDILYNYLKDKSIDFIKNISKLFVFSQSSGDIEEITNKEAVLKKLQYRCYNNIDEYIKKRKIYLNELLKVKTDNLDYLDFIEKYKDIINSKDTLLIADPPYLNTSQKWYTNSKYFSIKETIDLLQQVKKLKCDVLFFNQNKKDMNSLLDLFNFEYSIYIKNVNYGSGKLREDVMYYIKGAKQNEE